MSGFGALTLAHEVVHHMKAQPRRASIAKATRSSGNSWLFRMQSSVRLLSCNVCERVPTLPRLPWRRQGRTCSAFRVGGKGYEPGASNPLTPPNPSDTMPRLSLSQDGGHGAAVTETCACSSVGEHHLDTVGVVGSIPTTHTISEKPRLSRGFSADYAL